MGLAFVASRSLVGEVVVAAAVVDEDVGPGDGERVARGRLVLVRVGVGRLDDRRDLHGAAADRARDRAVDVGGGDHRRPGGRGGCRTAGGQQGDRGERGRRRAEVRITTPDDNENGCRFTLACRCGVPHAAPRWPTRFRAWCLNRYGSQMSGIPSSRRPATLASLAAELGVSRTTVSNAYNRPDQLSAPLRARVLEAARRLGYPGPDPVARSLRTRKAGRGRAAADRGAVVRAGSSRSCSSAVTLGSEAGRSGVDARDVQYNPRPHTDCEQHGQVWTCRGDTTTSTITLDASRHLVSLEVTDLTRMADEPAGRFRAALTGIVPPAAINTVESSTSRPRGRPRPRRSTA